MMDTRFTADDKLVLTNLSKVFWPELCYTKGDLIAYYREIALVMLPYLADRPPAFPLRPRPRWS